MKKLSLLLLLFATPLYATIVQISHTSEGSSDGNSVTNSTPISTTGASLITLEVVSQVGIALPALTESTGNITFSTCGATQADTISTKSQIYYWAVTNANQTSGTHTFTATQTGSFPTILVQSWSGTDTSSPCDHTSGAATDSAITLATGSITPTTAVNLVVTSIGTGSTRNFSINGGFTEQDEWTVSAGNYGASMAYLIQAAATAANPTWDNNGAATAMATPIASFKAAATSTGEGFLKRRRR